MTHAYNVGATVALTIRAKEVTVIPTEGIDYMEVRVQLLKEDVELPAYQTPGASGMDVRLHLEDKSSITLSPGDTGLCPTGFALEIPRGYEGQIRPRSGMALKGLTILNTPGTIDSDYRGEVMVMLRNTAKVPLNIEHGERIAQLIFQKVTPVILSVSESLVDSRRGKHGFGSTGSK